MTKKAHFMHTDRDEKGRYLKGVKRKPVARKRRSPAKTYDDIMKVFDLAGGIRRMAKWARNHPTAFYTQVLPRALPQAVMQKIWMETESDIKPEDKILFIESVNVPNQDRVAQLEKLLKEHKIALPPKAESALLPESTGIIHDMTEAEKEPGSESKTVNEGEKGEPASSNISRSAESLLLDQKKREENRGWVVKAGE